MSASTTNTESSTCRILTVSSTLRCAIDLVDRITAAPSNAETVQNGLGESSRIPWTISNKYYSADVHFEAHTVSGLAPHMVDVPAVIYVWPKGEAYKHHIERLAGDMNSYDPEVSLAVRVASTSAPTDAEDESQDDVDIDEFLSTHGFEFIDASEEQSESSSLDDGIPGLPRVVDALSTIMWPSMQTRSRGKTAQPHQDLDWATSSRDEVPDLGPSKAKQQEMDELARWLEEDDTSPQNDPWRPPATSMTASPPTSSGPVEFPETAKEFGFDDDFTVFVSAPPVEEEDVDSDDDLGESLTTNRLGLAGSGPLYLSLGSSLDLQQVDEGKEGSEDEKEDDEDMPTEAEIDAMTTRIFGGPMRDDAIPAEAGDEYDMAAFDLSRVMSALEGMKAEIANMDDEAEKRKAAASVAISLVYGLQAEGP
ncbi:hypothetical protein HMN09_01383400 [Mycena chlorophos]|uniref:Alpha/gamma-adaptin-binding protein p34 n=1 Tax=Mycena chlorophos TaxID=658473 RepID=A0A8H6RWD2_MYCCL|nr:hypothetical protein HMN09_01383400 [Mycena chlorophos]